MFWKLVSVKVRFSFFKNEKHGVNHIANVGTDKTLQVKTRKTSRLVEEVDLFEFQSERYKAYKIKEVVKKKTLNIFL